MRMPKAMEERSKQWCRDSAGMIAYCSRNADAVASDSGAVLIDAVLLHFVDTGTAVIIAPSVPHRHQRRWERLNVSDPAPFLAGALVHHARWAGGQSQAARLHALAASGMACV